MAKALRMPVNGDIRATAQIALAKANTALQQIADLPTTNGPFTVVGEVNAVAIDWSATYAATYPIGNVFGWRLSELTGVDVEFNPDTDFVLAHNVDIAPFGYGSSTRVVCMPIGFGLGVPEVEGVYTTHDVYVYFVVQQLPRPQWVDSGSYNAGPISSATTVALIENNYHITHCRWA